MGGDPSSPGASGAPGAPGGAEADRRGPTEASSSVASDTVVDEGPSGGDELTSMIAPGGLEPPLGHTSKETIPTRITKPTTEDASTTPLAPIPVR